MGCLECVMGLARQQDHTGFVHESRMMRRLVGSSFVKGGAGRLRSLQGRSRFQ